MSDYWKGRRLFDDEERGGLAFREVFTPNREVGPLRARPHRSGKGGPSVVPGGNATTGHRYWRINIAAVQSTGYASLAEVQFRTTAGVPLLFSGGTASASSFDSAPYVASMATDNDPATFWASANMAPQWWAYDYGASNALSIVEITIQVRPDVNYVQGPTSFTPQWSDDGVNWTSMAQLNPTPWAASQIQTFPVTPALLG